MQRRRPRQHVRRLESGKKTMVNKGMKLQIGRRDYDSTKQAFEEKTVGVRVLQQKLNADVESLRDAGYVEYVQDKPYWRLTLKGEKSLRGSFS